MNARVVQRLFFIGCAVVAFGGAAANQGSQEFTVDPAASTVMVHVGRAGIFGFAGHDHEVVVPSVQGSIRLDSTEVERSSVTFEVDATTIKVTGRGEPAADVPEVQRIMLSERVLDVQRYPTIAFASRRISVFERSSDRLALRIDGDLTLRGITRSVTVPVEVRLFSDRVTATGKATVRQTDFGIRPVSAGAGTVRVKDEVDVVFSVVARQP